MTYRSISSAGNPRIQELRRLMKRPSDNEDRFIVEGLHPIETAMSSGSQIQEIFFTSGFSSGKNGKDLIARISRMTGNTFEISDTILNKIAGTVTPQGVIAIVSVKKVSLVDLTPVANPLLLITDGVQDPGNLGTIIRSADAAGSDAVIVLPGTCSPFNPKVLRSTAGSIFNIPIIFSHADELLKWLKAKGIRLAITAAAADMSVFDASLDEAVAFVIGNESRGISKKIKDRADLSLRIPIYGKAESLNAAISASICLYEAARQRRQ